MYRNKLHSRRKQHEFFGINEQEKKDLKYEIIPYSVRLNFTKMIRVISSNSDDTTMQMVRMNQFVNIARIVKGHRAYVLDPLDGEFYHPTEYGWHTSQIENILFDCNAIEFIETIGDFIQIDLINVNTANEILTEGNCSFNFNQKGIGFREVSIRIRNKNELDTSATTHVPNVNLLIDRMDILMANKDYSGVLHSAASIFEALAKEIYNNQNVENQSFGSLFEGYKKRSTLPEPLLNYMLDIYKKRNTEPIAGHGGTITPTITEIEAIQISVLTKAIVLIEQ